MNILDSHLDLSIHLKSMVDEVVRLTTQHRGVRGETVAETE